MFPNYPKPYNPLVIRFMRKVPALKNEKSWNPKTGKPRLHKSVTEFFRYVQYTIKPQIQEQGFTMVPISQPVAVYVELSYSRYSETGVPVSDGDNAYTTLVETLQEPHKVNDERWSSGAILGVLERDRQVMSWRCEVFPSNLDCAVLYAWALNLQTPRKEQWMEFEIWHEGQGKGITLPIKTVADDFFISFGEDLDDK